MKWKLVLLVLLVLVGVGLAKDKPLAVSDFDWYIGHPQGDQYFEDDHGQQTGKPIIVVSTNNGISLGLVMTYGGERIARLGVYVENGSSSDFVFTPSAITVQLPDGNYYHPYSRQEVIDQIAAAQQNRNGSTYNPPPVSSYASNCNVNGQSANCNTTESVQSAANRAGYNVGYALGEAISQHRMNKRLKKDVQEILDKYMVSQTIAPGTKVFGNLSIFIEGAHGGPFVFSVPQGDKVYKFLFGPEILKVPSEVKK